jgi:hypothetical protein
MAEHPNPGSREAQALGCTCAVLDNHYGRGFPWGPEGRPSFWTSDDCPLHGRAARDVPTSCPAHGSESWIVGVGCLICYAKEA